MSDLVRELALGLARADTDLAIPADASVMLVRNVGAVPPARNAALTARAASGFNAILLDQAGRPTHFCKCRPAGDPRVAHEVAVSRAARGQAPLSAHVPQSALASTPSLSAGVSPYEEGRRYDLFVGRQSTAAWSATIEEIVAVTERVSSAVADARPDLAAEPELILAGEATRGLEQLARLEVPLKRRDALVRALVAGGGVRTTLQHGALRPSRVLLREAGWLLLGLGEYGRIRTPLYDLFHLLQLSFAERRGRREGAPELWIEALRDASDDSTAARAILRRAVRRFDLGADSALGALAYYVIDRASRARHENGTDALPAGALDEVNRLADLLRQGAGPVAFGLAAG